MIDFGLNSRFLRVVSQQSTVLFSVLNYELFDNDVGIV
jgi:hypothetical protein